MIPGEHTLFSVLTPVFDPSRDAFDKCVQSMLRQSYPHWEWCLVDDCSTQEWVWKYLKKLSKRHPNIKVAKRNENGGISLATNDALAMATGDFVAFLDNDDELDVDALGVLNHELFLHPSTDVIYTDEDKIDEQGVYSSVFHKPDWSPERLLCQNYCCHLTAIRTELVRLVGGLRSECDGAQDHDLLLRVTEGSASVRHIDRVLYHWRVGPSSTASDLSSKPYGDSARKRAIEDACQRRGIQGEVVASHHGYFRVHRQMDARPRVSIIVPTRGTSSPIWGLEAPLIENFLLSSDRLTTYPDVEYVVVYDKATEPDLVKKLGSLLMNIRLVEYGEKFNFSKKCNLGAIHSSGEYLFFVNDDVEVITPEWIERLACFLEDRTVGAVGPILLFENGLVETAGHTNTGPKNFARGMSPAAMCSIGWPLLLNREVSGVSGACLGIRRSTFFEVGGFSEMFAENFNDVDLCMKLTADGYRIIWTPDAELYHFEFKTRSRLVDPLEEDLLRRFWGHLVGEGRRDPFLPAH